MRRVGVADLPLHWGHVPPWLAEIMRRLAAAIIDVILIDLGRDELLRRLANPLWFQAFNNVIGMDWDSSGSTTVTTAIIKEVLIKRNEGIYLAGGKGRLSRRTPDEIVAYGEVMGLSTKAINDLIRISKLSAKTDNALLQDGFTLYHHAMLITEDGKWVVIQQGMNPEARMARRYHLAWFASRDVTLESHSGVASDIRVKPLNLTVKESVESRKVITDLINDGYKHIVNDLIMVNAILKGQRRLFDTSLPRPIDRSLPYYRPVAMNKALLNALRRAYDVKPREFKELLLIKGLGPEALRALSLISELIYREPPAIRDADTVPFSPFKYAFAIGGKDGVPYPVKKDVAEAVIRELEEIIRNAEVGDKEKLIAFRALRKLAPKDVDYV